MRGKKITARSTLWLLAVLACSACEPSAEQPVRIGMTNSRVGRDRASSSVDSPLTELRFADATSSLGVQFEYESGEEAGRTALPEVLGGGVALIDFNLDGRPDLFCPGGGRFEEDGRLSPADSGLFLNQAKSAGNSEESLTGFARVGEGRQCTFTSVGALAGLDRPAGLRQGAFSTDFDEDGFPDLIITGWRAFALWRNQGDGTFVDVTNAAGVADDGWTTGVAWGDVNGDGWLDLYVARFVDWDWSRHRSVEVEREGLGKVIEYADAGEYPSQPDRLWLSAGDGTWREATESLRTAGSAATNAASDGAGLSALMADFDQDGDLDIYVANFGQPNRYYRNEGAGKWSEMAELMGTAGGRDGTAEHSAGVDLADLDRDGYPDLWVVNSEREVPSLYRNVGTDLYCHVTFLRGLNTGTNAYSGWGTALVDLDRDEDLDVLVAGGSRWRYPRRTHRRQTFGMFENLKAERFSYIGPSTDPDNKAFEFLELTHTARGLAVGDWDVDGDVDFVVSLLGERVTCIENRTRRNGHWVQLRLVGTRGSRTPVGARVSVVTKSHDQTFFVHGGGNYLSSNEAKLFIGLGANDFIEELRIDWPGGATQRLSFVDADQRLTLVEPQ